MVPTKQTLEKTRDPGVDLDPSREDVLAYQFKPGQIVLDRITGKEVKILAADRGDLITKGTTD